MFLVLGQMLDDNDIMPAILKDRCIYTWLHSNFCSREKIFLSGGYTNKHCTLSEAEVMSKYFFFNFKEFFRFNRLVLDRHAKSTEENLKNAFTYMQTYHIREPLKIITSDFHVPRVKLLARRIFGEHFNVIFCDVPTSNFNMGRVFDIEKIHDIHRHHPDINQWCREARVLHEELLLKDLERE